MRRTEPADIRLIRGIFRKWPFTRGKGLLLKTFMPMLRQREFVFEAAEGVLVPADLDDWISLHGLVEGYDADFSRFWSLIHPGDTVFDVGANIGVWSIGASRRVGLSGRVHSFEPLDSNFTQLRDNIRLNRAANITAEHIALMDRIGPFKFYPSPNHNSGVGRVVVDDWSGPYRTVEGLTLDDYLERKSITRVHFVKLDVEGAEYFVLKGSTNLLKSTSPPLIGFEVERTMTEQLNYSPEDLESFLLALGYRISAFRDGIWQPISLAGFVGPEDLLAVHG